MNTSSFLLNILPIILFVFIEIKYGLKAGIIAAILLGIGLAFWTYAQTGMFDNFLFLEIGFLIVLGAISIHMKNSKYFKFQPMVIGLCLTAYMLYLQIFAEPVLIHYLPMATAMQPELAEVLQQPQVLQLFATISLHLIPLFFFHALWVGYAAVYWGSMPWLLARLAIYPMIIALFLVDKVLLH